MKIVIIGSGIVGASAAYHAARGGHDVYLVDNENKGAATDAGAGIICPWITTRDDNWYNIAKRGARYYPELIDLLAMDGEYDTAYKKVGALSVSSNSEELDSIEKDLLQKQKDAPEMGEIFRLNRKETQGKFPLLKDNLESSYVTGAARIDGKYLRDSMRKGAIKHGVTAIEGEASLIREGEQITGVAVKNQTIMADRIIIASGAWAPSLLKSLGMEIEIQPQRGQIAHITMPDMDTSNWPVILPQSSHYILAFDDSKVVAGATRETGVGFDYRLTAGGVHEVLSEAFQVAPGLKQGTLKEMRIGFRPVGPDPYPLIGKLEPFHHVIMANGLGPSGLTMGPYIGKLAASIANDEAVDIDLTRYSPMRAIN
ncbi:NAD(P)/FAD-dependent oxidoreductase [Virgibacillus ainsalahensis]